MKKIFLLLITVFLVLAGIMGCRTSTEWKKIDTVLETDTEGGKYYAVWNDKIQVKTDTWEDLMRQIHERCPKKAKAFIYFRPKTSWRDE